MARRLVKRKRLSVQAGYFDQTFKRILESEAYSETLKVKRQERLVNNKKHIGKIFVPNPHDKDPCVRLLIVVRSSMAYRTLNSRLRL